jgi:hypothetical protein
MGKSIDKNNKMEIGYINEQSHYKNGVKIIDKVELIEISTPRITSKSGKILTESNLSKYYEKYISNN